MSDRETSGWIDVSVPVRNRMVHWPGDPPVRIERISDLARGDQATVSKISMSAHTGTHMDAPVHFIHGESGVDAMPMDAANGRARIIQIHDPVSIKPEELEPHHIQGGERILFKTDNSARCWGTQRFVEDFVSISMDGAEFLAGRRIRAVGIDYLSVGGVENGAAIHRSLLGAGIWIIEGLNLAGVTPGPHELVCLPLRLEGADGAPARAMVRPL